MSVEESIIIPLIHNVMTCFIHIIKHFVSNYKVHSVFFIVQQLLGLGDKTVSVFIDGTPSSITIEKMFGKEQDIRTCYE